MKTGLFKLLQVWNLIPHAFLLWHLTFIPHLKPSALCLCHFVTFTSFYLLFPLVSSMIHISELIYKQHIYPSVVISMKAHPGTPQLFIEYYLENWSMHLLLINNSNYIFQGDNIILTTMLLSRYTSKNTMENTFFRDGLFHTIILQIIKLTTPREAATKV